MKKKILLVFSAFFVALFTISNVYAINVSEAGQNIVEKGEYNSTRFIAGNKVTSEATIEGISFVAGNEVELSGKSEYGFYAGNIVNVKGNVEKDLFVAGNSVTLDSDAVIGRDAYVFGNSVDINTNIERDLRCGGVSVDISGITINGDAYIEASEITMNENTKILGKLQYNEDATVEGLDSASIESVEKTKAVEIEINYDFKDEVRSFIFSSISAFITLVVLFYLVPKSKERLDKLELSVGGVVKGSLLGLLLLIVVPIIAVIAMITVVLIPVSLITLVLYAVGLYLSSLLVFYIVGSIIAKKVIKNENVYLAIACGVIVTKLVMLIPVIKGFVILISLLYGLSLIFSFIKNRE